MIDCANLFGGSLPAFRTRSVPEAKNENQVVWHFPDNVPLFFPIPGMPIFHLSVDDVNFEAIDLAAPFKQSWPVSDQGASLTCIAHTICACLELHAAISAAPAGASEAGSPERLSARFLYAASRRHPLDPHDRGWHEGGTRFQNAILALREDGICSAAEWPNARQNVPPVGVILKAKAACMNTLKDSVSENPRRKLVGPDAEWVATHLSQLIIEELKAGRPLGLAFPIYPTGLGSNNWVDSVMGDGTVAFPLGADSDHDAIGGHAVCITGVKPDPKAEGNGWVLFRNSIGSSYPRRHVPEMTGFGYGRMTLADANRHAWDLFTLRPNEQRYAPATIKEA